LLWVAATRAETVMKTTIMPTAGVLLLPGVARAGMWHAHTYVYNPALACRRAQQRPRR